MLTNVDYMLLHNALAISLVMDSIDDFLNFGADDVVLELFLEAYYRCQDLDAVSDHGPAAA